MYSLFFCQQLLDLDVGVTCHSNLRLKNILMYVCIKYITDFIKMNVFDAKKINSKDFK